MESRCRWKIGQPRLVDGDPAELGHHRTGWHNRFNDEGQRFQTSRALGLLSGSCPETPGVAVSVT